MSDFENQKEKISTQQGFVAALDQSGGSTPRALALYGIGEDEWSDEDEMFSLIHQMRTRIMTCRAFNGNRILAAILFEHTMDSEVEGKPTADYLWDVENVVPILKVDKGLADESDGVQLMKPIPGLDELLDRAREKGIFGTKMRSVIKESDLDGIAAITQQQFEIGKRIIVTGLVPIVEPEVDIHCPNKDAAEHVLLEQLTAELDQLDPGQLVMLKLTLPEEDNLYRSCIEHPNVLKVVALSGGFRREEANRRLRRNHNMVASFSRALTEGLTAQQTDEEFNRLLDSSIQSIFEASCK